MEDLSAWQPRSAPKLEAIKGNWAALAPFDPDIHGEALCQAIGGTGNTDLWTYVPMVPPLTAEMLITGIMEKARSPLIRWFPYVIYCPHTEQMLGTASYMRVREAVGSAEVGCVVFSKELQRTPAATEAMFIMARHIFDELGYRRYEWKCNADNQASRNAAQRLGFSFEGTFRQDMVVKGRNRDTAWFSIINGEWPKCRKAFENWLSPDNFMENGMQRRSLMEIRQSVA